MTNGVLQTIINALQPISDTQTQPVVPATASRDGANLLTQVGFLPTVFDTAGVVIPITDPTVFPIAGIQATVKNAQANFVRNAGKLGGQMPLVGVNKVCLFAPCSSAIQNLSVPISVVGQGGTGFATGAVNITVVGAPWTQGTAAVGTVTMMGNAGAGTQMTVGTHFTNDIALVTPVFVSTNIPASAVVPVFGSLAFTLSSPEPGALAAFGAAFVSLLAIGVARRRRS